MILEPVTGVLLIFLGKNNVVAAEIKNKITVPINASLQELGQQSIGSGGAVALQNFFQNAAMLLAVGTYTLAASQQVGPIAALLVLGGLLVLATFFVVLHLPENSSADSLE